MRGNAQLSGICVALTMAIVLTFHLPRIILAAEEPPKEKTPAQSVVVHAPGDMAAAVDVAVKQTASQAGGAAPGIRVLLPLFGNREIEVVSDARLGEAAEKSEFVLLIEAGKTIANPQALGSAPKQFKQFSQPYQNQKAANPDRQVVGFVPLSYRLTTRGSRKPLAFGAVQLPLETDRKQLDEKWFADMRGQVLAEALPLLNGQLQEDLGGQLAGKPALKRDGDRIVAKMNLRNTLGSRVSGTLGLSFGDVKAEQAFDLDIGAKQTLDMEVLASLEKVENKGTILKDIREHLVVGWDGLRFGPPDAKAGPVGSPNNNKPVIALATGNETVSFKRDIAPFMVNLCLRCHSGDRPRSEFSLETFEKLMKGGQSGPVVIPGDLDASRLWDLAGLQRPIKMPQGQALLTRKNWNDLQTWITEGAKFDGDDPKAPLRSLVPTETEKEGERFANMSADEFLAWRKERSGEQWHRVLPKEEPRVIETDDLLLYGNVEESRLQEVSKWAEQAAASLRETFGDDAKPLIAGKLAVFVMKDRFSYTEFNLTIEEREVPPGVIGHFIVAPTLRDAYVVLEDVGDKASSESPGLRLNMISHVTGAWLKKGGANVPDWLVRGTGLFLAAKADKEADYFKTLRSRMPAILKKAKSPSDVIENGLYSPTEADAVGYTFVEYLVKQGGAGKFAAFVREVLQGTEPAQSLSKVYAAPQEQIARAYVTSLSGTR